MYAIICFDRPESARLRDAHRSAHVQFLNTHAARIVFGGPLKGSADGPSTGALIVVNCATREEAEALIGGDPFYAGGVYESVSIRAFKQVFPAPRP
jgi:uncharacterized protein YciI